MVVNRGDIKRKRKDDPCFSLLDENPKRTKVHAQRKFAQGSNVSSPVITPVKEIERQERNKDVLPEPIELLPMKRPNTEDFLTFLCFRGTPILPPNLNFFNATSMADLQVKNSEPKPTYHKNGPILTTSANKSQNEKPFVAFGVRKRADPIVISKQMDRKRRHALALQALRRKYQEQKMAKIRAVTISKLSEKSVVRTRSVTKNEIACKKPTTTQKTEVKIQVASKQITTKTSSIKQPIKSKMCLRSFRGRYIHKELNVKTHKKRPNNNKPPLKPPLKTSTPKKIETEKSSSEFSSDDDEPLIKTRAVKKMASANPVKKHRRTIESSVRLTRSHNNKLSNKLQTQQRKQSHLKQHHRRIITRLSTGTVKNKIVQSTSIIRNLRRSVNTITRRRNQKVPQVIRATRQRIFKNKVEKHSGDVGNIAQTRSRAADNANNKVVLNAKEIACKKEELGRSSMTHDDAGKRRSGNINKSVKLEKPVVKECNTTKKDVKIIKDSKIAAKNLSVRIEQNKRINPSVSPVQTKKKSPISTSDKAQKPKQSPRSRSSSSAESIEEEQDARTKDINTENTIRRRSIPNKKKITGEKVLETSAAGRPSRKTKEAAAIYMELLGHKLVNSGVVDDEDDESIVSFPELPNVRKTEQRENELKARISKSKSNVDQDEVNVKEEDGTSNASVAKKAVDKTKLKAIVVAGDGAEIIVLEKSKNKGKIAKDVERDKNEVQEKSSPKKADAVPIVKEVEVVAKEEKSLGVKRKGESKVASKEVNQNAGVPKGIVSRQQRSVTESDIDNAMASMFPPNHLVTYNDPDRDSLKGSANGDLAKTNADQSFSDSDEEPLSNLTKSKDKTMGSEEGRDLARKKEKLCEDKPKRDSSPKKKPHHNYLPFSSSDDEEKYFHGFVKTELKTSKQLTVVIAERSDDTVVNKKCPQHSLPSSDLSCKDVSRRYGKGKVNMSNEQIEKWLNDSAMAAKKEDDDMMLLKYAEEDEKLSSAVVEDVPRLKLDTSEGKMDAVVTPANNANVSEEKDFKAIIGARENEESCSLNSSTPEKGTGADVDNRTTPKSTPSERKTIFRKEKTGPVRNANAFSASNECSVYAFEADNEDSSVSTPFRRPCRRPSSTATSKSEDDSKAEDLSKYPGKFRFPAALRSDLKTTIKQQTPQTSQDDSSTNEANVDLQADTSNSESPCAPEDAEQRSSATQKKKYIPPESRCNRSTTLINKTTTNTKAITKAKSVVSSQPNDKSMFPPSNTVLQKGSKCEPKYSTHKTATGNNHRSVLEAFEDAKYKIPSSPSASSSSSAKLASKRQPTKARHHSRLLADICTPVNVVEFPGCEAAQSRIVEAPAFRPSEREFQDPLEYIEKIRAKAEKFGICRIIPPANFKPECKVSDDMRFTAYNQYVHKMLHRWGPNFKELMAIRKYLETQNITLTHPPWIGGMEIDLPRLYQTVQSLGGLKEVIEKKKWPKVSEMMKIPKSAQDRVTKLDDIYCKYLLPYDTLSPAEREKLFDEVETEWAKRESKTLLKVQRLNKVDSSSGTDADSDSDNESEECIVKGRNIALNAFYRIARNTMSMWFRASEPSAEEVEQEFWRHVTHKNSHICVHSGSIDSGNWGYGFAVSKNSPFARHAWNLKVLTNNSGSVLRSMGPVMGVTVPTLHVGMVFSACCWYRDPHRLPWIEYLHTGAHKIWYGIPDSMSERFHDTMRKLVPNYCRNKSIWLPSDTVMVPPKLLVENGVSLCRTVQEPGQFVVVFPKVFTSSVSTGYVVSESVYFAPAHWLRSAPNVFDELRNNSEPSMFSIDRLLLSITSDARSSVDVLNQVIPAIRELCERERRLRDRLRELGLKLTEKLPPPEVPAVRKRRKLLQHENAGDYECEICRANLFLSLVTEYQEDVVYCLEHVIEYIQEKRIDVKNCKLLYTYECQELDLLLDKIKSAIETKQQKKTLSSKVGLSLVK